MRKTLAFIAVLVGLFASTYLTWAYTSSSHRMVCLGGGCDTVRASKFAHLWGLPLPVYGVIFYAFVAVLMLIEAKSPQHRSRLWRLLLILLAGGVLFSGWLTFLEAFVIQAWCEWCVTQAVAVCIAFLLTATIVFNPPRESAAINEISEPTQVAETPTIPAPATTNQFKSRIAVLAVALIVGIPALLLVIRHEKSLTEQAGPAPQAIVGSQTLIRPDSHETGPADALLTIVEFGDFQCPSCGVAEKTNRAIRDQYADKVRFVFRQFPLEKIHPFAFQAAKASECSGQQGKFWQMTEMLYTHQTDLSVPSLQKYAADEGLDTAKFSACLEDPAVTARIRQDIADGEALGVRATPTFFLNGKKVEGGLSFMDVEAALSAAKKQQNAEQKSVTPEKTVTAVPENKPAAPTSKPEKTTVGSDKQPKSVPPAHAQLPSSQAANPMGISLTAKGGLNPLAAQPKQSSAFVPCGVNEAPVQDPPMIHVAEMKKLLDDKSATFVDVRGIGAFKEAHIPTAVNATIDQIEKKIPSELSKAKQVVLYEAGGADESCATSRTAGRILMQNGFKEVKVFKEGLEGWKKQGLPIAR